MTWRRGHRVAVIGTLALALAACVPVTVNVTFPQEKLDNAARQIEDTSAQSASASPRRSRRPRARAGRGASTWLRRPGSTSARRKS